MNITKENWKQRWAEVSGFRLYRLIEDDQRLSLPMLTKAGDQTVLLAFVYSCREAGKLTVTGRHLWTLSDHKMMLCHDTYKLSKKSRSAGAPEGYEDALDDVMELLFAEELSEEARARCLTYFSALEDACPRAVYLAENKPLADWARKLGLLP